MMNLWKGGCALKKVMSLTQILLRTFSVTQSLFLLGYSISPGSKKSTSKKVPTNLSEITMK